MSTSPVRLVLTPFIDKETEFQRGNNLPNIRFGLMVFAKLFQAVFLLLDIGL